jgi:hypothetical protein
MQRFSSKTVSTSMRIWQPSLAIAVRKNFSLQIANYGVNSIEYKTYLGEDEDYLKFSDHMLRGTEKLDSLYNSMSKDSPVEERKKQKEALIGEIVAKLDTLSLSTANKPASRFSKGLPNNAYFMNFRRYQAKQDVFWQELRNDFHGDLKAYIDFLSQKYPFL